MEQQVFVTTLAGKNAFLFADGIGTGASINQPIGVAVDTSGNVYVADTYNHRIRKITSGGVVSTLAGSVSFFFADGIGTGASFNKPSGVAVDTSGNVYVADTNNHRIRKITSGGVVSTLAGNVSSIFADGIGAGASFRYPSGVTVDTSGNVYVADTSNHRIRRLIFAGCLAGTECIDPVSPLPCPKNTRCMPCSSVRFLFFSVTFAILCSYSHPRSLFVYAGFI